MTMPDFPIIALAAVLLALAALYYRSTRQRAALKLAGSQAPRSFRR